MKSIYIIKSGTCEIYCKKNPLMDRKKEDEKFFLKLPMAGDQMCLGLNRGSMSSAFNYYPISRVGPGTWLGEESFFMDVSELNYSVKAITKVELLEIGIIDFSDKMPPEMINELRTIALKKQF